MNNPFELKFEIYFETVRRSDGWCYQHDFTRETSDLRKYEKYTVRKLCRKFLSECKWNKNFGSLTPELHRCSFQLGGKLFPLGDDIVNGTVGDLVHVFRDAEPRKNEMVIRIDGYSIFYD